MTRRHIKVRSDKAGNVFLDVPMDGGSRAVRVSFSRWYFDPPVGDDDSINIAAAAEQLQQDIRGGTLQLQNLCGNEDLSFPVEIELESRDNLEALIRAIRRVFKEGLKRSNNARLAGLERCQTRLTEASEAYEDRDRRRMVDRRSPSERRSLERRKRYSPPTRDTRTGDRRAEAERRSLRERRAA